MSDDERLRAAYQEWLASAPVGDRTSCPAPEALRAAAEREGAEAERLSVLDHAMGCPACRAEFALVQATAVSARPATRRPWMRLGLAAAVLLSALAGALLSPGGRRGPEPMRTGADEVEPIGPSGDVPAGASLTFTWHAVPGARDYDVELLTPEGEVLLATRTADTVLTVPAPTATGELRWWVNARRADGERASRVTAFRLLR